MGEGLFARRDLAPGVVIGDYLGKVLRTAEVDISQEKENFYLMYYHDRASIYPDLEKPGVHLLNHSCMPNCALFTHKGHILFFTLRRIFAGEELTISYMLSPKTSFCEPCNHTCKCGSKMCNKSMHLSQERYAKWRSFQETQARKTKRGRINYNKPLAPLSSYPKFIPDHPIYSLFGTTTKTSKSFPNKKLPPLKELRKLLRETGRALEFPALDKRICGVAGNIAISERLGD